MNGTIINSGFTFVALFFSAIILLLPGEEEKYTIYVFILLLFF